MDKEVPCCLCAFKCKTHQKVACTKCKPTTWVRGMSHDFERIPTFELMSLRSGYGRRGSTLDVFAKDVPPSRHKDGVCVVFCGGPPKCVGGTFGQSLPASTNVCLWYLCAELPRQHKRLCVELLCRAVP